MQSPLACHDPELLPAAVLLPTILGLIAMFVVVTHFWDHHDERPAGTCHPRPRRGHRADERLTA
jgi:hypothetical protein